MDNIKLALWLKRIVKHHHGQGNKKRKGIDKTYLYSMLDDVMKGEAQGHKASRYLGYVQGVTVAVGATTIQEINNFINK